MARGQRDTHSRDQDFEYTFAEDYGDATKYFVLAGFEDIDEVYSLESKIEKLGGMFLFILYFPWGRLKKKTEE